MHLKPKQIIPIAIILLLSLIAAAYYVLQVAASSSSGVYSGTIEATEIQLGSLVGGRVVEVNAREGDMVEEGVDLVEIRPLVGSRDMVRAPIDGVILYRSIEPGEIAAQGTPLITMANLDELTLTVYVPEDRYGQIKLGERYPVTVDSYPDLVFNATVSHIAEKAEFTPRNVQTIDSRKTTVFAIKLALDPYGGKLKPGMPADVHFNP